MSDRGSPPASNAPSVIGGFVAPIGAIELQKLLEAGDGRAPPHSLVGRELYLDARHHQRYLTTLRRNPACRFDHATWSIEGLPELPLGRLLALESRAGATGDGAGGGEISLEGHVFVKELSCRHCGQRRPCAVLSDRIEPSQLLCERCKRATSPTAVDMGTWLCAGGLSAEMLRQPLRERGFLPGDVLTLRTGGRDRHFEYAPKSGGAVSRGERWRSAVQVGCGNIGSHLTAHIARLARSGALDRVILVDPDTYSESNVSGQEILCSDVGRPKVLVQAERMRAIHPELDVLPRACRIEELPLSLLRGAVLLGAVDSRDARQQINQAAWRIGSPWIDMAVDGPALLCRVTTYMPGDGLVCLECGWDTSDYALLRQSLPCEAISDSERIEATENAIAG